MTNKQLISFSQTLTCPIVSHLLLFWQVIALQKAFYDGTKSWYASIASIDNSYPVLLLIKLTRLVFS